MFIPKQFSTFKLTPLQAVQRASPTASCTESLTHCKLYREPHPLQAVQRASPTASCTESLTHCKLYREPHPLQAVQRASLNGHRQDTLRQLILNRNLQLVLSLVFMLALVLQAFQKIKGLPSTILIVVTISLLALLYTLAALHFSSGFAGHRAMNIIIAG